MHQALEAYSKAVFVILKRAADQNPAMRTTTRIQRTSSPGTRQFEQITYVDWSILLIKNEASLNQISERQHAVDAIRRSRVFRRHLDTLVGTTDMAFRMTAENILHAIVLDMLRRDFKEFSTSEFKKCYIEMEQCFSRNTIPLRFVAPLENFEMDTKSISLGSGLTIARLTDQEFTELYSGDPIPGLHSLHQPDFVLIYETDVRKRIGDNPSIPQKQHPQNIATASLEKALTLLRLFKPGNVDYRRVYQRAGKFAFHMGGISFHSGSKVEMATGNPYKLSKRDTNAFLRFWRSYRNYTKVESTSLDVAVRRFGFGYNRLRIEDRFIDYLIGFEALCFTGSERQELGFKLALRVGALLGKTSRERRAIYLKMKKAYTLRSEIVHGEPIRERFQLGGEDCTLQELTKGVEELLRLAILRYFTLLKTRDINQVVDFLDGRIISR